jgi:hypothetical protein
MTNRIPSFLEYLKSISISAAGSGYGEGTYSLKISAPTGDNPIQAVATATVGNAGSVTSVSISEAGDGYNEVPTVFISGPITSATSTSTNTGLDAGTYTGVEASSTSGTGTFAAFTIVIDSSGSVTSVSLTLPGNGYVQGDTVTFDPTLLGGTGSNSDVVATITEIQNGTSAAFTAVVDILTKPDTYSQPKISKLVSNQLPEFIRNEHTLFATFIEKYFEFLESNNTSDPTKHGPLKVLQDFLSKLDVDFNDDGSVNTDDNFLKEFYKDYAKDLPLGQTAKLSLVLKNINDFYTAKGSGEAIKLLFRILYNEEITLSNAQEFVLRPSSSRWQQDYVVKVYERGSLVSSAFPDYNPEDFVGQQVDLHYSESIGSVTNGLTKRASVQSVKKIAYTNPQAYELVLTGIDNTFSLPGGGAASLSFDEILLPEISGDIATIVGTAASDAFAAPSPSVVNGTYVINDGNSTSYIDVPYANNAAVTKGTYVKANNKIYLSINAGTTKTSGTGPSHEQGEVLDGTCKFRFIEISTATGHYSSGSSGAILSVVIAGNAVSSVSITDNGTNYYPNEVIEIASSVFGGTGTGVFLKVGTISSGRIKQAIIMDAGSGFSANPSIVITPNVADTISTGALLETRVTDGVISQILFTNNQSGVGYNNIPAIRITTGNTLSFVSLADEVFPSTGVDVLSAFKGIVTRVLNTGKFNSIKVGSSTTTGGFKIGDSYLINEGGSVLGKYAVDYFLEEYTLVATANNAYVRITALDETGYPKGLEVLAVGQGFNREDFQGELSSPTGNIAIVDFKTGYNAVLGGVAGDSGGFLSDANRLFDNQVYQPYAYQIQSELQSSEWSDYVKRAAHPAGFALFGDLQIKQDIDFSTGFTVETDVYMLFKYPDIEELIIQDTIVKGIEVDSITPDSLFPGDALNSFDVETSKADIAGVTDEEGPYTYIGTSITSFYATSDGTETGDPYTVVGASAADDYVERLVAGDYFAELYTLLGNPIKDVGLNFNSADTGEYATGYFENTGGARYTQLIAFDAERSTSYAFLGDTLTNLSVETAFADSAEFSEHVLISFVFFRNPVDSFNIGDASVIEARPTVSDTFNTADSVNTFGVGINTTNNAYADHNIPVFVIETVSADTSNIADVPVLNPQLVAVDGSSSQDTTSLLWQGVKVDTSNIADTLNKFDIGLNPSDSADAADGINSLTVETNPTESADSADVATLSAEIDLTGSSEDENVSIGDSGSLISQSYTVNLTYFAGDYVADTVVSF